jgi:hypothetical protein
VLVMTIVKIIVRKKGCDVHPNHNRKTCKKHVGINMALTFEH